MTQASLYSQALQWSERNCVHQNLSCSFLFCGTQEVKIRKAERKLKFSTEEAGISAKIFGEG